MCRIAASLYLFSSYGLVFYAVFCLKPLNASPRKDSPLLAGEERMALGTDFHLDLRACRSGLKSAATGTGHFRCMILGMNVLLHNVVSPLSMGSPTRIPEK